jgi:Holliday junction resolvase RusA-like endonuclease
MKLVIPGNTPSQKNRKIISVNRATGRPFLRSAPAVKEWQSMAQDALSAQFLNMKVTEYPIALTLTFWFDNERRHDLDNACSTVMDALAASGIIEDDNVLYVDCIVLKYGGYSKENPRVEIDMED